MTMKWIEATVHTLRRATCARAVVPLALAGLLGALTLGLAAPRASAVTSSHSPSRSLLLVNANGAAYPQIRLQSAPFRTAGPVTRVWKVASAPAAGMRCRLALMLLDA